MKTALKSVLFAILVCYSCNNNKVKNSESPIPPYYVDIEKSVSDKREISLSSLGKKLEYIPLETKPECMLSRATSIEMTESYIFVSDGSKLIEFDKSGKYIRQIGKQGRGPEEYLNYCDFCVDDSSRLVYVLDEMALKVYDFDGKFIESNALPFLSLYFTLKNNNKLLYYTANAPASETDTLYSWYVSDLHGGNIDKYINYHKRIKGRIYLGASPLFHLNKEPRFMEFGSDTLLYFNDDKLSPYAIFKFGALKMDPDPIVTPDNRTSFDKMLWPVIIDEDYERLYITSSWGFSSSRSKSVYNKITNETMTNENGLTNDLDKGLPFWPVYIYNSSVLVDQADAFALLNKIEEIESSGTELSGQLKFIDENLTENSNPVLIVLRQ
ncbi:MAG TPA: 6-bladed beta-propeller [Bacteroidales bacterium]|nr:6-bladed beta-propeller [Bacteroidales bacterium]